MIAGTNTTQSRILIVDDEPANLAFLERLLDLGGYDRVFKASSGQDALKQHARVCPDLILLDLQMPGIDGFEILRTLRERELGTSYLPILVLTADASRDSRKAALELGASDFLTKPGDATEILLRVRNFLTMRSWNQQLSERNTDLEARVRERTKDLEDAHVEIVERLALAGEFHDMATGMHTHRVGRLSGLIAEELGMEEATVKLITLAAKLHDLGKIGVPDQILLKPGKLSPPEMKVMKTHCDTGSKILAESKTPFLQMAQRIALSHHEKFDGSGYPFGLKGHDIAIEGRIVAVADVFDSLTHVRPYKPAWPFEQAIEEIRSLSGTHFDPTIVDAFLAVISRNPELEA